MRLPLNCTIEYFKDFLSPKEANELYTELAEILTTSTFKPQVINGVTIEVNFNKIMFLDQFLIEENRLPEAIWGPNWPWTEKLKVVKERIAQKVGMEFQVCVLIFYPDGESGVDFHSDFPAFGDTTVIPSISLGEERDFQLKEKANGEITTINLANGSMIVMGEHCQNRYEHALPTNPKYKNPRINLTFRKYGL